MPLMMLHASITLPPVIDALHANMPHAYVTCYIATCCDMLHATCHMPHVTCYMPHATLLRYMPYYMPHCHMLTCYMPHASIRHMPHCHYAFTMPHATCYMLTCYMLHKATCHYAATCYIRRYMPCYMLHATLLLCYMMLITFQDTHY
jgi:hypothetical protein